MIKKALRDIYTDKHGKVSDRWELYLAKYEEIFVDHRDKEISLLEIGVQNGGSLEVWSRYFPGAKKLVGCDVNPDCLRLSFDDPRIFVVLGDANEDATQSQVLAHSPAYDIIIDDGSHRSSDIVKSFCRYFPQLKNEGIYVAEDLHCSYWAQYEGGLHEPLSSVSFFKRLVDIVNFEHWGLEWSRVALLQPILGAYDTTLDEVLLSRIHSVEFLNSLCVIRKKKQAYNRLGARIVVGEEAEVVSAVLDWDGDLCERVPQSQVSSPKDPILVVDGLRVDVAALDAQLATLSQRLCERDSKINELDQIVADCDTRIVALKQSLVELKEVGDELQSRISALLGSTSWRITAPLRALREIMERRVSRRAHTERGSEGTTSCSVSRVSSEFDAEFYLSVYPDLAGLGIDPRDHYFTSGQREGRLGCPPVPVIHGYFERLDSGKQTALVVSHEASRTGAPILALNISRRLRETHNVIALLLGGGSLVADFIGVCDIVIEAPPGARNPLIISGVLRNLFHEMPPTFAIVNSIESRAVLPCLASMFVPSVCLVHEFAAYTRPLDAFPETLFWASEVVFSAAIVAESAQEACPALYERETIVLAQGRSIPPAPGWGPAEYALETRRARRAVRPSRLPADTVVILGAGSVHSRKGVDLFLACAAKVLTLRPDSSFHFVWVGHGYDPQNDTTYSVYLRDQLHRSDLENIVSFAGEFPCIELAYELSDILFLSSRLDPLPNVVIDAAYFQLPVVCFDRSTGIADILVENGLGDTCVAPYLDVERAAQLLVDLIDNADLRARVGHDLQELGARVFNMTAYAASLVALARQSGLAQVIEREDCAIIERTDDLRVDFVAPPSACQASRREIVRTFVRSWGSGARLRKPLPGFHPGIYRDQHGVSPAGRNPLADYIAAGRPTGPWLCDVIEPLTEVGSPGPTLRTALHIHAYYTDLVAEVLARLHGQSLAVDLLISVASQRAAEEVRALATNLVGNQVEIRVVPNRGRDIGPLLTEFGDLILANYDVIGHVHTKKTTDLKDPEVGRVWGEFLLENLVGGRHPMAAKIIAMIESDERLGLVFPDDPYVWGWTENKAIASELASGLDIAELPERYFWFPIGTMFWARTQALGPILSAPWNWEDYPEEPLPYDGTVLHAIERLLPFVAEKMGYRVALTNVPGVSR